MDVTAGLAARGGDQAFIDWQHQSSPFAREVALAQAVTIGEQESATSTEMKGEERFALSIEYVDRKVFQRFEEQVFNDASGICMNSRVTASKTKETIYHFF